MNIKTTLTIIGVLASFVFFGLTTPARAATLFLAPSDSEAGLGEKVVVDLKVDGEGESFNAVQATIRFPKDIIEVSSLVKAGSALSFWLEEPNFSNSDGVISFIGGLPQGISGASIQILKIEFKSKGSGGGNVLLSDAAISASDGSGANILSKTIDAAVTVVAGERVTPTPRIPPPVEIQRKPIPASTLPVKPFLKVPLYPDPTRWYNLASQFTVSWDLPLDISGVATAINKQPNFIPPQRSEGLFDNETFAALSDGTSYLHVRFQNNIGWGPTVHYRLAVDTAPPIGFELAVPEGEATDNPTPTLQFKTSDALSGLKEYQIRIGEGDSIKIPAAEFQGSFVLPQQAPGQHTVAVKAMDEAENSIEDSVTLDILPIASPAITFVSKQVFSGEEAGLTVKGTALPNVNVLLTVRKMLKQEKSEVVAKGVARTDDRGNWEFTFVEPLRNGRYVVEAQSQDARGALSLIAESSEIRVKSKPIIQIGAFQLGMGGAALSLLLLLVAGFGSGAWFYRRRQEKLTLRVGFAESEISKIFKLIAEDVARLSAALKSPTTGDDEYALKRLQDNITKMGFYLKKGIEKIRR